MTSRLIKVFLLILVLAFGLAGQGLAFACQGHTSGGETEMAHHDAHDDGHDMAGGQMHDGCPNCRHDMNCNHTTFHCLKAADNSDAFVAVKKIKSQVTFVLPPEIRQFKARHHQIRAPGAGINAQTLPPATLAALHIRLQV